MTGLLPRAQSQSVEGPRPAVTATYVRKDDGKAAERAKMAQAKPAGSKAATAAAPCADCGVVDSIRTVEVQGQGTGVGAVAGGVVGGILGNQVGGGRGRTAMTVVGAGAGAYAGHELEKNMKKNVSYEIRVRMENNSYRTFRVNQTDIGVGQRVRIRDGQLVRAG
jgi:outer membrane lipoprotein SlyB